MVLQCHGSETVPSGMTNLALSQIINMSTLVLTISFEDLNLFLIQLMFNCAKINWMTFGRREFFKIVLAESGEPATSPFSVYIDSNTMQH